MQSAANFNFVPRFCMFGNFYGISDMVIMAMSNQDMICRNLVNIERFCQGIWFYKRIEQQVFGARMIRARRRFAFIRSAQKSIRPFPRR